MHYVISDIHGCRTAYRKALEVIGFSDADVLYVLGDVVDRGEDPVGVLQDMMERWNVIPLTGNHEYMMMRVLSVFSREITEESLACLSEEDLTAYMHWTQDGGDTTLRQFAALSHAEQQELLDYVGEFSLYEEVRVNGKDYVLVHAGLEGYRPDRPLEDYDLSEMIFRTMDPDTDYDPSRYIVSGHTPTLRFSDERKGKIVVQNHQILTDCGCVFGGALGIYRLEDGKTYYVDRKGDIVL